MSNLNAVEIKTFIPCKNFALSKQFYLDLGFNIVSDSNRIAYLQYGTCSFLLQDFYEQAFAENLMIHFLVEDIHSWHEHIIKSNVIAKYDIEITDIEKQPFNMLDFIVFDPSGVVWRFGQNI